MSFLNGRIDFTADMYFTKTNDVIMDRTIPVTNGSFNASTRYMTTVNVAKTKNVGFELAVNSRNIITKDFTWSTTFTFAANNEKVQQLYNSSQKEIIGPDGEGNNDKIWKVGKAINSYFNYQIDGNWQ